MTGFKSGASSDDPLGGDESGDDNGTNDTPSLSSDGTGTGDTRTAESDREDTTNNTTESASSGLPWIYERNSITDGRSKTVQLHLQRSTLQDQRTARSDIEVQLGEEVQKADLREAALLVGLQHIDEVADQLREWGYDIE